MDVKLTARVLAALSILALLPGMAAAKVYEADTDTGANRLDFVENLRRLERENAPTQEQLELWHATEEMKQHLRQPVDATQAVPTAFEGDELTYDQNTGEFIARGKVHIVQMDGHQFDAVDGLVTGNTQKQEISVPGQAHVLQITPGQARITLDGFNTFYRYGEQTGTMEAAKGKVDHQYVSGKRFEFYPDRVIIYEGTTTKCGAKKPDYHLSGDKITIYPNDKMIIDHAKFWARGAVLYSRKRYEQSLEPGEEGPHYPRIGYSKKDGVWIEQNVRLPLGKGLEANGRIYANTKDGLKSRGTLDYRKGPAHLQLAYGNYEDSNDRWLKRDPSFRFWYSRPLGYRSHLNYSLETEHGRWHRNEGDISSMHRYYKLGISRDPIRLGRDWFLFLSGSYSVTQETYNHSENKGYNWDISTVRRFDDRWAAYLAYAYSTNNTKNSLFDYNLDSYSRKAEAGFSYRLDDKNRFVVGLQYDLEGRKLKDVDYYWFHDLHCSQVIVRYREKRNTWKVSWEFTPW